MTISDKTRKLLWGRSGSRCAICREPLIADASPLDQASIVGEECHIIAQSPGGPRYEPLDARATDEYGNLILLCCSHHKLIDDQPKTYDANDLRLRKKQHEEWVHSALGDSISDPPGAEADDLQYGASLSPVLSSDVLFALRLSEAFPGARGLEIIDSPVEALDRLDIVYKAPIVQIFGNEDGSRRVTHPFWWFRGHINMFIRSYERIAPDTCLLAGHELLVSKLAVFRAPLNTLREFVYLESAPQPPSGAYQYPPDYLERAAEQLGFGQYVSEDYAAWCGRALRAEEHEDGSAMIDGRPTLVNGSEIRTRYLTSFNLVLCGNRHVINDTPQVDQALNDILDGILTGVRTIQHLAQFISTLPRPSRYLTSDW